MEKTLKSGLWSNTLTTNTPKTMQAILTKYIPCTNTRGSRIKASCERGSCFIPYPHHVNSEEGHKLAAQALVDRFVAEDVARYGTNKNPWSRARVSGGLPDGTTAHVFVD